MWRIITSLVSFGNAVAVFPPSAVFVCSLQPSQPTVLCQCWQADSLTAGLDAAEIDVASGESNSNNDSSSFPSNMNNVKKNGKERKICFRNDISFLFRICFKRKRKLKLKCLTRIWILASILKITKQEETILLPPLNSTRVCAPDFDWLLSGKIRTRTAWLKTPSEMLTLLDRDYLSKLKSLFHPTLTSKKYLE